MWRHHATRRDFFGTTMQSLTFLGLAGSSLARAAGADAATRNGGAKRCVVLWMNGGPSQLETFDPKPGTSTGGPTTAIATSVPGITIAEHLPKIAERMHLHTIVRNLTSSEGEHERAQYYLHTGFQQVPAFPRPALGSVVSNQRPQSDSPKYVLLGGRGFGPAYCGPEHASFTIEDAASARELLERVAHRREEMKLLAQLGDEFDRRNAFPAITRRKSMISRIERLGTTPLGEALDLVGESVSTRQRYGESPIGDRCLLARRLLERDVPFVEVQLDGWDTHVDNFNQVSRLAAPLDQAWSALVDDLVAGGLWDDTLLVWLGDFGRTPVINGQNGRDHFPAVTPAVFGGGVIRAGGVIGATNHGGTAIEGDSWRVADLAATILQLMGIDPDHEFRTSFDSPTTATDDGQVIQALIG